MDDCISAIVNIGHSKTEISIFNKGIMIKNKILSSGSKVIDKEIACSYGIKLGQARSLKENFALADTRYADSIDTVELINKDGIEFSINQLEISNMVENSLIDMLKEVKKQINILTNRKISYIIIAGGISNIAGFEYAIENVFDKKAVILLQNAFPTLEKYIDHVHTVDGKPAKVPEKLEKIILENFENLIKLKKTWNRFILHRYW